MHIEYSLRVPIEVWDEPTAERMLRNGASVEEVTEFLRQRFRTWLQARSEGAS